MVIIAYINDFRIGNPQLGNKCAIEKPQDTAAFLRATAERLLKLADRIERWAE